MSEKIERGHTHFQWLITILANLTLVTYGQQAGWISPMTKVLQSDLSPTGRPLTDNEMGWIASILCLSAVVGVPIYTCIADTFGRRVAVIAIAVPQALSWLTKFSSANLAVLIIARIFCGIAAGGCFNVIPIYVKEISRDDIRGLTGSLMMLCQNLGILMMYALGAYLDYWTVLWVVSWLPFVTAALMMKAPESPAFLVKVGMVEEASTTIAWLRGLNKHDKIVQNEIQIITNEILFYESLPNVSCATILKHKAWRRGILLIASIFTVNAMNGIFVILTYASTVLESSGVTFSAEVQSLSFPAVMILAAFVSMGCVERYGRKPLVSITLMLMMMSLAGLASVILLQDQGVRTPGWLPAGLMVTAVAACAAGAGPVPYIMMSEMFNFQIRAKVVGTIVAYSWFLNFVQLLSFAPLSAALGMHTTFYCFGAINCLGFCVALVLLPETKGKSVEEIEAKLGT